MKHTIDEAMIERAMRHRGGFGSLGEAEIASASLRQAYRAWLDAALNPPHDRRSTDKAPPARALVVTLGEAKCHACGKTGMHWCDMVPPKAEPLSTGHETRPNGPETAPPEIKVTAEMLKAGAHVFDAVSRDITGTSVDCARLIYRSMHYAGMPKITTRPVIDSAAVMRAHKAWMESPGGHCAVFNAVNNALFAAFPDAIDRR